MALQRLRRQLDDAVDAEDYELAARLRDDIKQMELDG
jgi:protein-arginine kinase activator protein McsA